MLENPEAIQHPQRIGGFTFGRLIGSGSFAIVRIATDSRTGEQFACKIIPRSRISSPELESRFECEIRVLQQMHHSNITQLYNLEKDSQFYYIFMELCLGGELLQCIVNNGKISENDAKVIFSELLSAIAYLHSHGAVHRDLKPENILFTSDGHIKLTDFGFSRYISNKENLMSTSCGTPCYASPECLTGNPYDGTKSDVWSAGVILFAMTAGNLPWTKKNQQQLFAQIQAADYKMPQFYSTALKDLISHILVVNPVQRYTELEILHHPWMKGVNTANSVISSCPVSLKQVDHFFQREMSTEIQLDNAKNICTTSTDGNQFSVILKMIKVEKLPRLNTHSTNSRPIVTKLKPPQRNLSLCKSNGRPAVKKFQSLPINEKITMGF